MQALVERYGGYSEVPEWKWKKYKEAKRAWWENYVRDLPKPKQIKGRRRNA